MKKNILFVLKDFPKGAGVERVTLNLANQFVADGCQVKFFITSELDSEEKALLSGFSVITFSGGLMKRVKRLNQVIRSNRIDVVIGAKEQANMVVWLASLFNRDFVPIMARHCAFDVSDQSLSENMLKCLYNAYALTGAKIITVSKALQSYIQDSVLFRKHNIHYCPNPVVSNQLFEMAETNSENFSYDKPYFCAVGRLCEQKGFDLLLQAYNEAVSYNPAIPNLVIVGAGPDLDALKAQAENLNLTERVMFTGFNRNPYYIMQHSLGFILSSRHEGLPTVLIEAMALDLPVVSFDCPTGPKEILRQGALGYLVENGDINALAEAILSQAEIPIRFQGDAIAEYRYENAAQAYYKVF